LDLEPNQNSADLMARADALPKAYRDLIHEFGFVIVTAILDDCDGSWPPPDELEFQLEMWRHRRQQEWLATDYFTKAMANSLRASLRMRTL